MADFLLEILSDEIPARMQFDAAEQLANLFTKKAAEESLIFSKLKTYVTPKRLVLYAQDLPEIIYEKQEELRGPGVNAPEKAIEGFCKSAGVSKEQLFTKPDSKYYFVKKETTDRKTSAILAQIIEKIMKDFQWAKTMRWGEGEERWVRPIRNILCLLGAEVVEFRFGRLNSCGETIISTYPKYVTTAVTNFDDYSKSLEEANIILDQNIRKKQIFDNLIMLAGERNLEFSHNEKLLNEVTGLVESPKVFISKIADEFLSLPPEMLITSMANHQRFFSFKNSDGSLAPYFAVVTNFSQPDEKIVIEGNKKVLEARLYDAKFFYENDCKIKLETRVSELKKVTFHSKLGSVFDKVQRIKKIAEYIANKLEFPAKNIIKVAELSKADLVTEAVFEFPELQGIMGKYYALHDHEDLVVAKAIEQHYWPVGRDDKCPESIEAAIISIADKLDTIVGLFSINEKPTSSKDPFALRRAAISIIRILCDKELDIDLEELIIDTNKLFSENQSLVVEMNQFIVDRLTQYFKDQNYQIEIINIVTKDNLFIYRSYCKIDAITKFFSSTAGSKIYQSIKRVNNILYENKPQQIKVDKELFIENCEDKLYRNVIKVEADIKNLCDHHKYFEALDKLNEISNDISVFFENVLVLDPDQKIKNNRLALLSKISELICNIADFSKIN